MPFETLEGDPGGRKPWLGRLKLGEFLRQVGLSYSYLLLAKLRQPNQDVGPPGSTCPYSLQPSAAAFWDYPDMKQLNC